MMAEISSKNRIAFASLILFSLIFLSFGYAAEFVPSVTPTSINEYTEVLLNFTINNTGTANITQVNITLPTSFSFVADSNGTTDPSAFFSNTSTTLNWTDVLIENESATTESFWFNVTASNPGIYNVTIDTLDTSPFVSSKNVTIIVDNKTAPTIDLISPDNKTIKNSASVDFNFTATDAFSTTLSCSLIINGTINETNASVQNDTETNFTLSDLSDGDYLWSINCTDEAGNEGASETWELTVDTTEPEITFVDPTTETGTYSQNYIEANVTASDSGVGLDTINLTLYNSSNDEIVQSNSSSTSPLFVNFTELPDGTYYLNATANDTLGNINKTETITITLDTTAPEITLDSPDNKTITNSSTIDFNFTATDAFSTTLSCSLIINGTIEETNASVQNDTETNFTLSDLSDGDYLWSVNCTDEAGNENASGTSLLTIDTTEPEITLISPANLTSSTTNAYNFTFNVADANNVSNCSLIFDGLIVQNLTEVNTSETNGIYYSSLSVGTHTWSINCTDVAENVGNSPTRTLIVKAPSSSSSGTTYPTYRIDDEELSKGYQKVMRKNWRILFRIDGESHTFKVEDVTETTAKISISSENQEAILSIGEEKKFEITGDNYYDILVRLNSIDSTNEIYLKADFTIQSIHEEIIPLEEEEEITETNETEEIIEEPIEEEPIEEEETIPEEIPEEVEEEINETIEEIPQEPIPEPEKEKMNLTALWIAIFVIVILIIFIFIYRRSRKE